MVPGSQTPPGDVEGAHDCSRRALLLRRVGAVLATSVVVCLLGGALVYGATDLSFFDDFDRADGDPGSEWYVISSGLEIVSNAAYMDGNHQNGGAIVDTSAVEWPVASVRVVDLSASSIPHLTLSRNSYPLNTLTGFSLGLHSNGNAVLYELPGWSVLDVGAHSGRAATWSIEITDPLSPRLVASKNGTEVLSAEISEPTTYFAGVFDGMGDGETISFDDFSLTGSVPDTVTSSPATAVVRVSIVDTTVPIHITDPVGTWIPTLPVTVENTRPIAVYLAASATDSAQATAPWAVVVASGTASVAITTMPMSEIPTSIGVGEVWGFGGDGARFALGLLSLTAGFLSRRVLGG